MKGFDIWLNDRKLSVAVAGGAIVIYVDKSHISISGIDSSVGLDVNWGSFDIEIDDKIKIIAATMDESDVPIDVKHIDRQELLAQYLYLKEILGKAGVLK